MHRFRCSHDLRDVYAGSFPFVYEDKNYSSCSIAATGRGERERAAMETPRPGNIFCGVADAIKSSGFDYIDCNMGSCNGPVDVSGKLKTADVRTGSADPIVPCWYDTYFRARVPQDHRNGASRTAPSLVTLLARTELRGTMVHNAVAK